MLSKASGCQRHLLVLCRRLGWRSQYPPLQVPTRSIHAAATCIDAAVPGEASPSEQQKQFLARKAEYDSKMSVLRKKYAAELAERKREKLSEAKKKGVEEMRAAQQRRIARTQEKKLESTSVEEEKKVFQAEQVMVRKEKELLKQAVEERLAARREAQLEKLRDQSGSWIEEKDLEHRINAALNSPQQF
eukprot:TRINITY_DN11213_c0_g1_i1.p1 TRINITY_DN11213_c0_g1~~TRINITY_DN11213_c0_g1_i1.p1  ORF type:complete len:189 (+),score=61.14 TRINITY_DN11213_c0_g1_i1:168-734(+)